MNVYIHICSSVYIYSYIHIYIYIYTYIYMPPYPYLYRYVFIVDMYYVPLDFSPAGLACGCSR